MWSGASIDSDEFASRLVSGGLEGSLLEEWLESNSVATLGGETNKIFDLTEEVEPTHACTCTLHAPMVTCDSDCARWLYGHLTTSAVCLCAPPWMQMDTSTVLELCRSV